MSLERGDVVHYDEGWRPAVDTMLRDRARERVRERIEDRLGVSSAQQSAGGVTESRDAEFDGEYA